jgi:hypothetical protein
MAQPEGPELPYDLAISFAGEDRSFAESLAKALRGAGVRVFYDEFERSKLWGKDLYTYLQRIYRDEARYCLVLVSTHYVAKRWTKHELRNAQARAFRQDDEYILPVKLDNTELPGVNPTVGYLSAIEMGIDRIVSTAMEKLGLDPTDIEENLRRTWDGQFVKYNGHRMISYWPKVIELAQTQTSLNFVVELARIRYGSETRYGSGRFKKNCKDCGVIVGQFHTLGCDVEECANCHEQLISCGCRTLEDAVSSDDDE